MKYTADQTSTLFSALEKMAPESSNNTLRGWIKSGRVIVNGIKAHTGHFPVKAGDAIALLPKTERVSNGVRMVYEDQHLAVIYKPSGLLSVGTAFEGEDTAHRCLTERYMPNKVYVVHRIDQDTSGLMMFARTEVAYEKLKAIFEAHAIEREYWAIVEGEMEDSHGTWQSYLQEDKSYRVWSSNNPNHGRIATTHYEVMATKRGFSLVRVLLETGRKHQIRVHFSDAGHPIVGDKRYKSRANPLRRLGLHARSLGFIHPITGKKMFFETPLPACFLQCVPYNFSMRYT